MLAIAAIALAIRNERLLLVVLPSILDLIGLIVFMIGIMIYGF
jgi:hypothetical protein